MSTLSLDVEVNENAYCVYYSLEYYGPQEYEMEITEIFDEDGNEVNQNEMAPSVIDKIIGEIEYYVQWEMDEQDNYTGEEDY